MLTLHSRRRCSTRTLQARRWNARHSTLDAADTVTLQTRHLARLLDSRQSDTGPIPIPLLDSNAPRSTLECSTLDPRLERLMLDSRCCQHCNPVNLSLPRPSSRRSTLERWLDADARHSMLLTLWQTRHLSITLPVFLTVDSRMLARSRCSTRTPHA
jgi:hypothetical protein